MLAGVHFLTWRRPGVPVTMRDARITIADVISRRPIDPGTSTSPHERDEAP